MGAVAFVAERRLLKVIRRRDGEPERPGAGDARPGAELALPAEKVGDQAAGQ